MPAVKIHTALECRTVSAGKTKFSGETMKQVFWQTSIHYQRLKLKIWINGIVIDGLLDTGVDVTILLPKYWHPVLPLRGKCSPS